jgi:hypothetical protein
VWCVVFCGMRVRVVCVRCGVLWCARACVVMCGACACIWCGECVHVVFCGVCMRAVHAYDVCVRA